MSRPFQVLVADDVTIEFNLDTRVAHITNISIVTWVTKRRCQWEVEQHIRCLAVEILDTTTQAALQE